MSPSWREEDEEQVGQLLAHVAYSVSEKISMLQLSTCWSLTESPMRVRPPGLDGLPRSMIVLQGRQSGFAMWLLGRWVRVWHGMTRFRISYLLVAQSATLEA